MRTAAILCGLLLILGACDAPEDDPVDQPAATRESPRPDPVAEAPEEVRKTDGVMEQLVGNQPTGYRNEFADIKALYNDGKHDEALVALEKFTEGNPDHYEARYVHGRILESRGDLKGALTAYGQAIAIDPDDVRAVGHRGMTLVKLERYEDALPDLRRYAELAKEETERAKARRAIEDIQTVLASRKKSPPDEKPKENDPEKGPDKVIDALTKNPEKLRNRLRDVVKLYNAKKYAGAIEILDQMLADRPDYVEGLLLRARCQRILERYDKSMADLDEATRLAPEDSRGWFERGTVYVLKKSWKPALSDFETALKFEKRPKEVKKLEKLCKQLRAVLKQ